MRDDEDDWVLTDRAERGGVEGAVLPLVRRVTLVRDLARRGWTQTAIAALLGINDRLVRRDLATGVRGPLARAG